MECPDGRRLPVRCRDGGVRVSVRVKPRSSRSRVVRVCEGVIEIALRSPPVHGAANLELLKLLSKLFGVPRSAVSIVSGANGRNKHIDVSGISRENALGLVAEAVK